MIHVILECNSFMGIGRLIYMQVQQVEALVASGDVVGQSGLNILAQIDLGRKNAFLTHQWLNQLSRRSPRLSGGPCIA